MKLLLIGIGLILSAFAGVQFYLMSVQKDIETYSYTVEKVYDDFEIRRYDSTLFLSVTLPTSEYNNASGKGFSILANYIFGGNEDKEKIAMTSPVAIALEDSITVYFMVPKKYAKESLPKPNSSQINFEEMPAQRVAAITFGGWANSEKIEQHKQELIESLVKEEIKHSDKFFFFGYNSPYETVNRRNEVIVQLK